MGRVRPQTRRRQGDPTGLCGRVERREEERRCVAQCEGAVRTAADAFFARLPGTIGTLGCWPSAVLVLSPCLHMPWYGCGPYTRGWRATDCRFEPGALVECRHGDGDGNWSHGTVTTSATEIKVRAEGSDGSGPNDENFEPHQVRRRGALPLCGYRCAHIACVCTSAELARRNARPPNSGKGRA